jgi:hypothetical protein
MRAWPVALLVLALPLGGCLGGGDAPVVVAAAPELANGMTVAVATPRGLLGGGEGQATFTVAYGGQVLYPPGGVLAAPLEVHEGKGSAFVPYQAFVVDNGDYTVSVTFNDKTAQATVPIKKWVYFVYALPYLRGSTLFVDLVLEQTRGQPNDRVFAEGELNMELRYRGHNGEVNQFRLGRTMLTQGDQSFQRIELPLGSFHSNEQGYYSVEATFHNFQASGNNNVGMDPELGSQRPPTNWVYIGDR